jgi:hypothetical protein
MRLSLRGRPPAAALAAAVAGALVLASSLGACGSDNSSSSVVTTVTTSAATTSASGPSGTASAALCKARDDLRSSVQELASVDVVKNGTSSLQAALTKVKNNLQAVKDAAGSDLQPQVNALQSAVDQLSTAVANVSSVGVAGVLTAARDVGTAGATLLSSLDKLHCS